MSRSIKPVLLAIFYTCNFGVVTCLLGAAFFLSQGLFGDLYSCNERTVGEIDRLYDDPEWPAWNFCLVDLNYTATPERAQEQSFYALQVTLPCSRIWEGQNDNLTYTSLCYNHYHPEYFSSISETDELDNQYSHNEAVRDMHLGFRAALWMALFGFLASAVHRNLDSLDHCAMRGQDYAVRCMQHARSKFEKWRARRQESNSTPVMRESELQTISIEEQGRQ